MSRQELIDAFSFEGINRSNAVVNFTEDDPFDPKAAVAERAAHLMALPAEELAGRLLPVLRAAGFEVEPGKLLQVTPLIQERIKTLRDVATVADFFFADELPPYDSCRADPAERGCGHGPGGAASGPARSWRRRSSRTTALEAALRAEAAAPGRQGRPDVPAHPRGRVRPQGRAAAV